MKQGWKVFRKLEEFKRTEVFTKNGSVKSEMEKKIVKKSTNFNYNRYLL